MKVQELALLGLVGWTAIGIIGVVISLARGERARVRTGLAWLVGVWVVYVGVVVAVSLTERQRMVALGQEQCFGEMCFAVTGVDEVPRYLGRNPAADQSRLIRVRVQVRNTARGKAQSERLIRAYLVDGQGRRWDETRGVNGKRLTGQVQAGGEMVSEPVFKVAEDATGLGLVFTRGGWQRGVLVVGDSDSWLHRRTVVPLGR